MILKKIKKYYSWGGYFLTNKFIIDGENINKKEVSKKPMRYDVINFLLGTFDRETTYLEIGVREPNDNFNKINASIKYSVDPGIENIINPVDFKVTSDVFFSDIKNGKILDYEIKFDLIFIDGLHHAEQVERDIKNSLLYIKEDGFIVLHDCNPPTEWHAREEYFFDLTPAKKFWNGTTWKAFYKTRLRSDLFSCCIDSDWGVGVISKNINLGSKPKNVNKYFEFNTFNKNRIDDLNLLEFKTFKEKVTANLNKI